MADTATYWRPSPTQGTLASKKKVPRIPRPRGEVPVPDHFIKQSGYGSYRRCRGFWKSSFVNAHTPSADTCV